MSQTPEIAAARRALALLDLTDLSDQCGETGIAQLCDKALGGPVPVAAICIWPQFVSLARRLIGERGVKVATVVNFPAGGTHIARVSADTAEAVGDGADEIDLVLPYKAFLAGDWDIARDMIGEVKAACDGRTLKVILETGAFPGQHAIREASDLAIASGADFIKTSTGKIAVSATLDAAETMLDAIKASGRPVGLKPSGGIRTLDDAKGYLALADRIMGPDWATAATFRFGASGLYQALVDVIGGNAPADRSDGAY